MYPTLSLVTGAQNKILHAKNENVKNPLDPAIQKLVREMIPTMRRADGIGLAAPQVGMNVRICTVEISGILRTFINPKITSFSGEKIPFEEGCLSLPGELFTIERSEIITLRSLDEKGKERKDRFRGLWAICLQHELDHLDGILICDRAKKQKRKTPYAL